MGKLSLSIVLVGAAACGSNNTTPIDAKIVVPDAAPDAKVFMDAPPPMFDLSCVGNNPPTPAAMVTISGTVTKVDIQGITPSFNPLVGATVDACKGDCVGQNKLGTNTTIAAGAFTEGPLTTGGTAINGYLKMTHTNDRTTFAYPATPLAADLPAVPIITFSPAIIMGLQTLGACTQVDGTNGLMAVVVNDCTGARITDSANIQLSIKQGTTPVGDPPLDIGTLAMGNAMAAGLFLVCNVPENTAITVGATYATKTFLAHDVGVVKGTTTITEIRPGY